jgi:hypothetical protein
MAKSVTHVSGTACHLCLGPLINFTSAAAGLEQHRCGAGYFREKPAEIGDENILVGVGAGFRDPLIAWRSGGRRLDAIP